MKYTLFLQLFAGFSLLFIYVWAATTTFGATIVDNLRPIQNIAAILGMLFFFVQYILSARVKILEDGFGLDKMLYLHQYFGRAAVFAFTIHGALVLNSQWRRLGHFNFTTYVIIGIVVLLAMYLTAGLASTYKFIRLPYQIWKNIHLINYVIFPLALLHAFNYANPGSFFYYVWVAMAAGFAALALYRLYRIFSIRRQPYTVSSVKQEAKDIWSLFFSGPDINHKPGQFLFVQLLRNGKLSEAHPFTITSSPESKEPAITIKELGDFTSTIKDTKEGDQAFIDAPYGIFSNLNVVSSDNIFIAGGIGITPFMSMLRYLKDNFDDQRITFFWGNRSEEYLCFQDELKDLLDEMPSFSLVIVMSDQKDWPGEKGFITADLIKKYHPWESYTQFFVCGPPPMTQSILKELKETDIDKKNIHYEMFDF